MAGVVYLLLKKTLTKLADKLTVWKSSPVGQTRIKLLKQQPQTTHSRLFLISSTSCQSVSSDHAQHWQNFSLKCRTNIGRYVQNLAHFSTEVHLNAPKNLWSVSLSKTWSERCSSRCCHKLVLQPAWRVSIRTFCILTLICRESAVRRPTDS